MDLVLGRSTLGIEQQARDAPKFIAKRFEGYDYVPKKGGRLWNSVRKWDVIGISGTI